MLHLVRVVSLSSVSRVLRYLWRMRDNGRGRIVGCPRVRANPTSCSGRLARRGASTREASDPLSVQPLASQACLRVTERHCRGRVGNSACQWGRGIKYHGGTNIRNSRIRKANRPEHKHSAPLSRWSRPCPIDNASYFKGRSGNVACTCPEQGWELKLTTTAKKHGEPRWRAACSRARRLGCRGPGRSNEVRPNIPEKRLCGSPIGKCIAEHFGES